MELKGIPMQDSKVTTALTLPGYRVVGSLGVVRGITVRSRSCVGKFFGGLRPEGDCRERRHR
jgi:uncharacterized protein YbjQ (UPF0145 family)